MRKIRMLKDGTRLSLVPSVNDLGNFINQWTWDSREDCKYLKNGKCIGISHKQGFSLAQAIHDNLKKGTL